ncbi:MAG: hypothetical protein ACJ764_14695 [Solirubrobacteraceae bacterium]
MASQLTPRRALPALVITMAALLASPGAGARTNTVTPALPSVISTPSVQRFPVHNVKRSFAVYDARGHQRGHASWLVTPAGGNCCEDYAAAQPNGRLLSFGGTYPMYSDDHGRTWFEVKPITPLNNGEGALVAGPNGVIAGIGWDFYSGDHAQAFRYDPKAKTWRVAEVPLKNPFFDRPWITVARGPFKIDGHTYPWLYLVRGGGFNKDPELISTDGLSYSQLTSQTLDEMQSGAKPAGKVVPVKSYGLADYWAPHPWAGTIPLSGGGLLQITQPGDGDSASCPVSVFAQTLGSWQCSAFAPPGLSAWQKTVAVCCQVRQDSRGWLSDVVPDKVSGVHRLLYRVSVNGGRTWSAPAALRPPKGGVLENDNVYNVVVNGRLGLAAVSARFDSKAGHGQDMVFVVNVRHPRPRLAYTLLLGKGNLLTANDVSGSEGDRFDYASVAILPGGRIVASFDDSTTRLAAETALTGAEEPVNNGPLGHNQPNLGILQRSAVGLLKHP